MTRRPRKPAFLSTFLWVVLLVVLARIVLVQCGSARLRPETAADHAPAESRPHPSHPSRPTLEPAHAGPQNAADSGSSIELHLALGVPRDADPSDDHLLDERAYVLSYNPNKRVANWAAWRLDASYLGHAGRKNDFRPDPLLPADWYHVSESDYRRSGYDRGHLCPSADRDDTPEDNSLTFLFTNMQPQLHELNAGPWEQFEQYERELAKRRDALLFIVAGGLFSSPPTTIGQGVAVPVANFKIVVVLQRGQGASDVTEHTEVLSVLMPNEHGVGDHQWTDYLTSVDTIEHASGYDFLTAVPEPIARVLEARTTRP